MGGCVISITLLLRPNYKFDECLHGYFQRVMKLNLYHHHWFTKLLEKEDQFTFRKYNIFNLEDNVLMKISHILGVELENLQKLNFELEKGRLNSGSILKMHISTEKMRICPDCLKEFEYYRKVWDLNAYTVCHIHKKLIIDECPVCSTKITFNNSLNYLCNKCGQDLCSSAARPSYDVHLSKMIYEKLHSTNVMFQSNNPLSQLSLNGLLGVLILVSNSFPEHLYNYISVYKRLTISDLSICLNRSYSIFENYPTNFHIFLEQMKLKRREKFKNLGDGVTRDFGQFSRNIYDYFSSDEFNFLRYGFEEYLDNNLQAYISSSFKKSDVFERKYMTGFQTIKTLGLRIDIIREFMNKGILRGYYVPENRLYNTILLKKDVEELKDNMIKGSPGLASQIGLRTKDAYSLIQKGIFKPVVTKVVNSRITINIYLKKEVNNLFASIDSRMKIKNDINKKGLITFDEALTLIKDANRGLIHFVSMLINGKCTPSYKNDKFVGFKKYQFLREDLDSLIQRDRLKSRYIRKKGIVNGNEHAGSYVKVGDAEHEFYSIAKAANKLNVTSYDISHWIKKGFINAVKERDNLFLIRKDDLEEFYTKYWTIGFLLLENKNMKNKHFSNYLLKSGFIPVSGPKVDGYSKYLFNREGIQVFIKAFQDGLLTEA